MSKTIVRSMFITVVLALVAFPMFAGHSWGGYHWARTTSTFTLQLGNNLTTTDWKNHLSQTVNNWNNASSITTSSVTGTQPVHTTIVVGSSSKRCSMVTGTTQVCNGTYGNNGWLGLASINLQSGTTHITQGSAKMNDTYFNTATYNNTNEREHVMCQEVAHTFGLDHQDTSGASLNTCMDYFSNTGSAAGSSASTEPNQHDYDELNAIYAHTDTSTTIAATPFGTGTPSLAGSDDEIGDTPATWGRVIGASLDGHTTTYEKTLANGGKVITFVVWATDGNGRSAR